MTHNLLPVIGATNAIRNTQFEICCTPITESIVLQYHFETQKNSVEQYSNTIGYFFLSFLFAFGNTDHFVFVVSITDK